MKDMVAECSNEGQEEIGKVKFQEDEHRILGDQVELLTLEAKYVDDRTGGGQYRQEGDGTVGS